ncbi:M23 family metallopeptidase [Novosphingobium sp.]|uniref:M23 family metallopeptidase n=1 Tax=Novosphingobium sp. TaxID=1874826 RepID=UPI003B52E773
MTPGLVTRRMVLAGGALLASAQAFAADDRFALTGQPTQGGWLRGQVPAGTTALHLDQTAVHFADDGAFLIAFDRDAALAPMLVAEAPGGPVSQTLAISPRNWQIQHVDTPMHPAGMPDAEFARRRAGELALIKAARARESVSAGWRQQMIHPAAGAISGRFGAQRVFRGVPAAYHAGMDIAAPAGAPILAPADGVVVLAVTGEPFTLEGHLVILDHGMGLMSALLHARALSVTEGMVLRQGQTIGQVGMTGRATGPHLHWGLTWHGRRLDPLLFLP